MNSLFRALRLSLLLVETACMTPETMTNEQPGKVHTCVFLFPLRICFLFRVE